MKFIIIVILICNASIAQCTLDEILPFETGITKYDVNKINERLNHIYKEHDLLTEAIDKANNKWVKYNYLKNDSVYKSTLNFKRERDSCINEKDIRYQLSFADDKLYRISLFIEYDDFNKMEENYLDFSNLLFDEYELYNNTEISTVDTNEKIGEGIKFYNDRVSDLGMKLKCASISKRTNFKRLPNGGLSSEVISYEIEISIINLKGTKLLAESY